MNTSLVVQYIIIALVVLGAIAVTFRKLAPKLASRWQASWSIRLNKPWRPSWQQALGRRLQPKAASGHCGDGCDTCGSCGPKPPAAARPDVQPLVFRPRAK